MGAGILRGVGDSKRPLYYLCISSVVNIILDIIFVVVFHMGVAGTAWATVISQVVSALMVVRALMRDDDIYRLHLKKLGINRIMLKRVLMMGIPSGIQNAIISFSNVVVQANINSFGADAMAGCSSYMKIDGFVILPIMSFGMAAMTFTGQNVGAGKRERVKKGAANTLMISLTYTVAVTVLLLLFGQYPLRVFSSDTAVNQNGYLMLRTVAPFYVTLTVAQVMTGVFRGAGKAITSMLLMVGSMVGIRMLWVNIMVLIYPELETVLWGYPVSWICAMLGVILYAWKGKWLPKQNV